MAHKKAAKKKKAGKKNSSSKQKQVINAVQAILNSQAAEEKNLVKNEDLEDQALKNEALIDEDLKNKGEDLEDAASQEQATQDVATQDETSPEEDQEKKALGQGKADFSASDGQKEKKTFNKMRVNVCGQLYNLRSEDSQEHLQRVADLVENKIEELRKHFADYSLNKLIMLAILQLADEKIKLEEDHEHLLQSLAESGISIDLQAKE